MGILTFRPCCVPFTWAMVRGGARVECGKDGRPGVGLRLALNAELEGQIAAVTTRAEFCPWCGKAVEIVEEGGGG